MSDFPQVEQIVLVMGLLKIHTLASLHVALPPSEAKRFADKLEIHRTPKHGSWFNMTKIELGMLQLASDVPTE